MVRDGWDENVGIRRRSAQLSEQGAAEDSAKLVQAAAVMECLMRYRAGVIAQALAAQAGSQMFHRTHGWHKQAMASKCKVVPPDCKKKAKLIKERMWTHGHTHQTC